MKWEQLYRQLKCEFNTAKQIHEQLLPKKIQTVNGLSFAAHYQPAYIMGGDFYDVIQKGDKLVIYLCDVSGHDLAAAMLAVFVKHTIKDYTLIAQTKDVNPSKLLHYLAEQFLHENYPDDYFICIFIIVLDLDNMELRYCGAGFHNMPLVYWEKGGQAWLMADGLPITSHLPLELLNFNEKSLILSPGTTIFLNTDGLTEHQSNGTLYEDRLSHVFYENATLPPQRLAQVILKDFQDFNNGSMQNKDDITFLILQVEKDNVNTRSFKKT